MAKKQEELARRRKLELLYQMSPFDDGQLIDEGLRYGEEPRNPAMLAWAESRLATLGLEKKTLNNTCTWVDDRENLVVYADIRSSGRIRFSIWQKPLPRRRPTSPYRYKVRDFYVLDSWKKDLKSKYESRLVPR